MNTQMRGSVPEASAQHTPGPWRVEGNDATSIEVHALAPFGKQCVAVMDGGPRMMADAHLIAAAPDLLAALQTLESLYGELRRQHVGQFSDSDRHITRKAVVDARAAIAKATQP